MLWIYLLLFLSLIIWIPIQYYATQVQVSNRQWTENNHAVTQMKQKNNTKTKKQNTKNSNYSIQFFLYQIMYNIANSKRVKD